MKDGLLLDVECVVFEIPSRFVSMPSMKFMKYSGYNVDIGIPIKNGNGRFELVKENKIVMDNLNAGKGVYFSGSVYFSKEKINESQQYKQFSTLYNRSKNKIERKCSSNSEQFLFDHVKEVHQVPIVKSIYKLYSVGLFSSDVLLKKLSVYLAEEHIAELVGIFEAEKEAA